MTQPEDICGHGFRTMACSALIESGLWSRDAVERQMSHQERNGVRAAYIHKAEHLGEPPTDATVVGRFSECKQRKIYQSI